MAMMMKNSSLQRHAPAPAGRGRTAVRPVAMHTRSGSRSPTREMPGQQKSKKNVLNGPCVIKLVANSRFDTPVQAVAGADLGAYIKVSPQYFTNIQMPMGGNLRSVDMAAGLYEITIPKMQLFDLWLSPKANALVKVEDASKGASKVVIGANDCILKGSHHVEQLKLNERFNLDVAISFASQLAGQPKIVTDGRIEVHVDIPPPFSYMPKPVLETTGNTALAATLAILLNTVVTAMASDYVRWARTKA